MATGVEELEDRVTALEHNMWGVRGDNGVVTALRDLTTELRVWKADEQRRRDDEQKEQRNRSRAIVAAAITSTIAMLGVIVSLVIALTGGPA